MDHNNNLVDVPIAKRLRFAAPAFIAITLLGAGAITTGVATPQQVLPTALFVSFVVTFVWLLAKTSLESSDDSTFKDVERFAFSETGIVVKPAIEERWLQRILVVEYEETLRRHLTATLAEAGFSVAAVNNAQEAVTALERSKSDFDLVLMDLAEHTLLGLEVKLNALTRRHTSSIVCFRHSAVYPGRSDVPRVSVVERLGETQLASEVASLLEVLGTAAHTPSAP